MIRLIGVFMGFILGFLVLILAVVAASVLVPFLIVGSSVFQLYEIATGRVVFTRPFDVAKFAFSLLFFVVCVWDVSLGPVDWWSLMGLTVSYGFLILSMDQVRPSPAPILGRKTRRMLIEIIEEKNN